MTKLRLGLQPPNHSTFATAATPRELSPSTARLYLWLAVPSLCAQLHRMPRTTVRTLTSTCAHTHRFPLQRRPHTCTSSVDFLLYSLCRPLFLLSRGHYPPGFPWSASFLFLRPGRGEEAAEVWPAHPAKAELWDKAGNAGLASGLRPVCFPFAP